ncbi:MAG: tRNA epoxyqueuosine(34) reductase QueG [Bacteroidales bacterium]|nr:tRNA epoxyqueuosine(34) reductase QueG [Bacteroidales bacterium]
MPESNKEIISKFIKSQAKYLGFFQCGISKARFLNDEAKKINNWLENSFQGEMSYMQNNLEKRLDPRLLQENAKSIISVLFNYFPEETDFQKNNFTVSKYAFGKDYHFIIKDKLKKLLRTIEEKFDKISGRVFVDSAPVLEKAWAEQAGLGWIGKNTCLINKNAGSFFFIGEIIVDIELEYDKPHKNFCGNCKKCLDACPTQALNKAYILDSRKCISYLTIESKEDLPEELKEKFDKRIFGCDICQDVCPYNRFSIKNTETDLLPNYEFKNLKKEDWINLNKEDFNRIFKNSALKRTKFEGLKRNIDFVK